MAVSKHIDKGLKRANWPGSLVFPGVMFGGNANNGTLAGLFYVNANNVPSNSNWNYGASHSYGMHGFRMNALSDPLGEARKIGRKKHRSVGASRTWVRP